MGKPFAHDWSVYLVTDRACLGGRDLAEVVAAAVRGGASVVQLREKDAGDALVLSEGRRVRDVCRARGVLFIVNDRPDLALELDADGVHVGQSDVALPEARRILGRDRIVGVSVGNREEAEAAERNGADYLGVSPVFDTPTKTDAGAATGLFGLAAIRKAVRVPLVAIGGVDESNAASVIRAGADGVAVVRAIMAATDPEAAAARLRILVQSATRDAGPRFRF
ncbi:MAG: thiamine phosphate synthase [Deltaproteobacteria bacterium]|nr:thiamine phosphate synthase [Deltaproteobacteria bacterium]